MSGCRWALSLALLLTLILSSGGRGQAQGRAARYFPSTGYALSDAYGFLSFWEAHGGEAILGQPISEPFEEDGRIVQYLERSRLEQHAELEGGVALGRLGAERTRWRHFPAAPPTAPSEQVLRFPETNHTLGPPFRAFWDRHGGLRTFGFPISEQLWEMVDGGFYRVQYFERTRLEHHPAYAGSEHEIQVSKLGQEVAVARGLLDGAPAPQPVVLASEPLAAVAAAPARVAPQPTAAPAPTAQPRQQPGPTAQPTRQPEARQPAAPKPSSGGPKRITIDLSRQWLYAYQGEVVVYDAPVATGKDGFNTPAGQFKVYHKVRSQTMRGELNGETWEVPNVPHVLYINGDVGLHGTYWHNLFGSGQRISHGCINLRVSDAAWLYEWAPVGTPVTVHY